MVSPRDAMEAVARAVAQSDELPDDMSLLLHEADTSSEDADVDLPLLEVQPTEVEIPKISNTDFVGHVTDDSGNQIGRVYHSEYEMGIQLDIWTSTDGGYDPDDLGERLRNALYAHSSYGPQQPFPDEEFAPIDEITYFDLTAGERADDLIQTPTVRKWSQTVELWGYETFRTDADYITAVDYPAPGDLNDSNQDGVIEDV